MTMPQFSVPGVAHLHGDGYSIEQFNAAVQARSDALYEEDMPIEDVQNIFWNVARDVYCDWNDLHMEDRQAMEFSRVLIEKLKFGTQSAEEIQSSGSGLLDPVHGITLEDWAATNAKLASGGGMSDLLKVLGVEQPLWDEAAAVWMARLTSDTTFSVAGIYGAAFTNSNIGKYANSDVGMAVQADSAAKAAAKGNFELYAEIGCAQSCAYEFGLDGAQYVKDTWGLTLGEWGEIASHWSMLMRDDMALMRQYGDLMDHYNQQYKAKFAAEQGGNVGDDINF